MDPESAGAIPGPHQQSRSAKACHGERGRTRRGTAQAAQAMADQLDGVFVCHEYPHIDFHLRAKEAIEVLIQVRDGLKTER